MEAFGLLDAWWKPHSSRDPTHCLTMIRQQLQSSDKVKNRNKNSRLTLNNSSGAFIVLGFGYLVSILVFILEHVVPKGRTISKEKSPSPVTTSALAVENKGVKTPKNADETVENSKINSVVLIVKKNGENSDTESTVVQKSNTVVLFAVIQMKMK